MTLMMKLQAELDSIDLAFDNYDYERLEGEELVAIGDLPDAVLRIYALYIQSEKEMLRDLRAFQEHQERWVDNVTSQTARTFRDYIIGYSQQTDSLTTQSEDVEMLYEMALEEVGVLFPELKLKDDQRLAYDRDKVRALQLIPSNLLPVLGLDKEFPELKE